MKKDRKTFWRKFIYVLTLSLMMIALVLGIVFSSLRVDNFLGYGASFNGGWQATIEVVNHDEKKPATRNQIAQGLSSKLAPFSNVPLTVSYIGENRVSVVVGKDSFPDRIDLATNIQSSGGLFVLTHNQNEFNDLYTDKDALEVLETEKRLTANELFVPKLDVMSLERTPGRAPYLHLGLQESDDTFNFTKVTNVLAEKQQGTTYSFVTDFESLIDGVKNFYNAPRSELTKDELIQIYWDNVIQPGQEYIANPNLDSTIRATIRDVFSGTVKWYTPGTGTLPRADKISLLDNDFKSPFAPQGINMEINDRGDKAYIKGIKSAEDLSYFLNPFHVTTPTDAGFSFNSNRGVDYYLYKPDTTKEDFETIYKDNRISDLDNSNLGSIENTFKAVTNFFLKEILLNNKKNDSRAGPFDLNESLTSVDSTIASHFVFNGLVYNNTSNSVTVPQLTGINAGFTTQRLSNGTQNRLDPGLYIPTRTLSIGKMAVASINQNALGVTYRVESINEVKPTITNTWLIISLVFLGVVLLLLIIFLLFVYRLLGLFTIIIAAMTAALTLVLATVFQIAVGPQLIMGLFLIIGLTIDLSLILYNAFSERIYQDKQAVKTAFKIANKETIGLTIDALIVGLLPNIIMFWTAEGDLKNFATISSIGIFFALIFGVVVLRFGIWLLVKLKPIQQNLALLPIDTNFKLNLSLKKQYLAHKYKNYLDRQAGKDKYSAKELLKMKRTSEKLAKITNDLEYQKQLNFAKLKIKDQQEVIRLKKQIEKYEHQKITSAIRNWSFLGINQKVNARYDLKINELESILQAETFADKELEKQNSVSQKVQTLKTEHWFNKVGGILGLVALFLAIVASIVGTVVGPNWSSEFGRGQQFVVYGTKVKETFDNTLGPNRLPGLDPVLTKKANEIVNDPQNEAALTKAWQDYNNSIALGASPTTIADNLKQVYLVQATMLEEFYQFIIDENLYQSVDGRARKISLRTYNIQVVDDYSFVNPETGMVTDELANQVAITINSNATDPLSRTNFRRMLALMANPNSNPWLDNDNSSHRNENGGVVGYDLTPYTGTSLIKQILIVFGIFLLALLVYIIIRFKWTYYVALALGLIVTFVIVVSLTILFRIPISLELMSGFALLISFVVVTMILVLGKGKSLLNVGDKQNLMDKFAPELEQSVSIRQKSSELDDSLVPLKKTLKSTKKKLKKLQKQLQNGDEVDFAKIEELEIKIDDLKAELKTLKKANRQELKEFKKVAKANIRILSRKNFFFKEVYLELINFTLKRFLSIGIFYLLTALVLLTTLGPMFGMGLIVFIGIIVGFMVTLFVVIPVWVSLEHYRLRSVSGFKVFTNNLEVRQEEQIVFDVND